MPDTYGAAVSSSSSSAVEKVEVRRAGMQAAFGAAGLPDGSRIWMPYSGPGDMLAAMEWPVERVDALDNDESMIRRWAERWPDHPAVCGEAEKWSPAEGAVYSVADVDAFGGPQAVIARWLDAPRTDPALLVATDGAGAFRRRRKRPFDFDSLAAGPVDSERAARQQRDLPVEYQCWLTRLTGGLVTVVSTFQHDHMWYMAFVLGALAEPPGAVAILTPGQQEQQAWRDFEAEMCRLLGARPSTGRGVDSGVDGWVGEDPVQVKMRHKVGGPIVREMAGVLQREKRRHGVIVALSFTAGGRAEADRLAQEGIRVELLTPAGLRSRQPEGSASDRAAPGVSTEEHVAAAVPVEDQQAYDWLRAADRRASAAEMGHVDEP